MCPWCPELKPIQKYLHLRYKWADGDTRGACYLSLDWICFWELLVLPSWCHTLCTLLIPAFCYFHGLIDDLITASGVCVQNTWVFLAYSFTQWRVLNLFVRLLGSLQFHPCFGLDGTGLNGFLKWMLEGTWDVTHRVIWCVFGIQIKLFFFFFFYK